MEKIALITGASRGIGKELTKQLALEGFKVIAGVRDENKGLEIKNELAANGINIEVLKLDISNSESIDEAIKGTISKYKRIDVLVNNAGIIIDRGISVLKIEESVLRETLETNFFGAFKLFQKIIPLMVENNYGRIINISSGIAAFEPKEILDYFGGRTFAYRLSKVMLNALTYMSSVEVDKTKIKINAVCPGSVRTDMGGAEAQTSVEDAAKNIIWLTKIDSDGPTGKFFRDGNEIPW